MDIRASDARVAAVILKGSHGMIVSHAMPECFPLITFPSLSILPLSFIWQTATRQAGLACSAIGDFLATLISTCLAARIVYGDHDSLDEIMVIIIWICLHLCETCCWRLCSIHGAITWTIALPFVHLMAIAVLQTPHELSRSSGYAFEALGLEAWIRQALRQACTREPLPRVLGTPGPCGFWRSGPWTGTRAGD